MKSASEFRASVYLRADEKREAIRRRNRKIRNAGISAGMLALVMALAAVFQLPALRLRFMPETTAGTGPALSPSPTQEAGVGSEEAIGAADVIDMSLVLRRQWGEGVRTVHINSRADEYEILAAYKDEVGLEKNASVALVPIPDQSETVQSREELDEYLRKLDVEEDFAGAMEGYDDAYFENNLLIVGAVGIIELDEEPDEPGESYGNGIGNGNGNENRTEPSEAPAGPEGGTAAPEPPGSSEPPEPSKPEPTTLPAELPVEPPTVIAGSQDAAPSAQTDDTAARTTPDGAEPDPERSELSGLPESGQPELSELQELAQAETTTKAARSTARRFGSKSRNPREIPEGVEIQGLLLVQAPKAAPAAPAAGQSAVPQQPLA